MPVPLLQDAHGMAAADEQLATQPQLTMQGQKLLMKRCWQLLHDGVTTLQHDLGLLAADEMCDDVAAEAYVRMLQHYRQVGRSGLVRRREWSQQA